MTTNPRATPAPADPADVKACCAVAYESDLAVALLGDSFHPGGRALSRLLVATMAIEHHDTVLDVASGPGTTALLVATETGARVIGVDLSDRNVTRAADTAAAAGFGHRVAFRLGDAEQLPLDDGSVTAVICECALCTFPDKRAAIAEMARVLAPGGRVGITDVTADHRRLPPAQAELAGWIACVADARPAADYVALLEHAGLDVEASQAHDDAAGKMLRMVDARLAALNAIGHPLVTNLDVELIRDRLGLARRAVADGTIGYQLIVARKPST